MMLHLFNKKHVRTSVLIVPRVVGSYRESSSGPSQKTSCEALLNNEVDLKLLVDCAKSSSQFCRESFASHRLMFRAEMRHNEVKGFLITVCCVLALWCGR